MGESWMTVDVPALRSEGTIALIAPAGPAVLDFAKAEHWMRVGMLTEMHPELDYREICQLLIRAELAGGLDIAGAASGQLGKSSPPQAEKKH